MGTKGTLREGKVLNGTEKRTVRATRERGMVARSGLFTFARTGFPHHFRLQAEPSPEMARVIEGGTHFN